MGRIPYCTKVGLRKGPWSIKEDTLLTNFILEHGEGQWRSLAKNAGLMRCGKSCRLRWMNYLRPGIKRGDISQDEEDLIVRLHGLLGNRWSLIAGRLPGRTDNEIKNYWNAHLLKKLKNAGITPKPHKDSPKNPAKIKKSTPTTTDGTKKNNKQTRSAATVKGEANEKVKGEEVKINENDLPKMKVYSPKPIRVSSVFPRTNCYDSLVSAMSSSGGSVAAVATEVVSYVPVVWSPLLEIEEGDYEMMGGGEEEDFLGVGCVLPVVNNGEESISGDVDMWEKVYDEFFQLL